MSGFKEVRGNGGAKTENKKAEIGKNDLKASGQGRAEFTCKTSDKLARYTNELFRKETLSRLVADGNFKNLVPNLLSKKG